MVTASDGEEAPVGEREQRSEIGPSWNVPPFSTSIALDSFHILKKSEAKSGIEN